jgi:hypothetical protein
MLTSTFPNSRDCLRYDGFHARRQGDVKLINGAMPLHFLAPIDFTSIHEESERVWLLTTFLILLLARRNRVKNKLFKNQGAVAPERAKTIWIEALE